MMKLEKLIVIFSLCVSVVIFSDRQAGAEPMQWDVSSGGNGHFYELFRTSVSWTDARDAAAAMAFMGDTGYLATITSLEENNFLVSTFDLSSTAGVDPNNAFAWIGASDMDSEGDWRWVVGPEAGIQFYDKATDLPTSPFNFAPWGILEPNNAGGIEDFAAVNLGLTQTGSGTLRGEWGDTAGNVVGYIVEYSVPEPGTAVILMGLGVLGLTTRRWAV